MQLISLAFMSPNQVEKQNEFHGILMHLPLHTDEICLMLGFLISGSISARQKSDMEHLVEMQIVIWNL